MNQIKTDIKERINNCIKEIDHSFSLNNYEYITSENENEYIANIYKQLGPFDFYLHKAEQDTELEEERTWVH